MRPLHSVLVLLLTSAVGHSCTPGGHPSEAGPGDEGKADGHADAGSDAVPSGQVPDADSTSLGDDGGDADNTEPDAGAASDADAEPGPPPMVAIYDDTAETDGSAWGEGLTAIEDALDRAGIAHERVTRPALNGEHDALARFDGIVFGGGFAYPGYTVGITPTGKERLRRLVEGGGVFVGICAGAYFACDSLDYEGERWNDESGYDLALFPGLCTGPVASISSYPDFAVARLSLADHPALGPLTAHSTLDVWYAGGPWFEAGLHDVEVLATYVGDELPEHDTPAVVTLPRGEGVVILFGHIPSSSTPR